MTEKAGLKGNPIASSAMADGSSLNFRRLHPLVRALRMAVPMVQT
jgi:hypothetical protein